MQKKNKNKKNSIGISVFYENKKKTSNPIYLSKKCCKEKLANLLLMGEGSKRYYVLVKEISDKQRIKMPKKGEYIQFKNYERKKKSPYA